MIKIVNNTKELKSLPYGEISLNPGINEVDEEKFKNNLRSRLVMGDIEGGFLEIPNGLIPKEPKEIKIDGMSMNEILTEISNTNLNGAAEIVSKIDNAEMLHAMVGKDFEERKGVNISIEERIEELKE